ncbi:MAG: Hemolysin [Conexibacter sp.]|nr:Hemolysin [Conexibacter sp.]
MLVDILVAFLLVAANGFFVAVEFSLARLRPTQVQELVEQRRPGAKSAQHALTHIDAYLAACQLGITLASLALGIVGEPAFHQVLEKVFGADTQVGSIALAGAFAFTLITLLHVVVGELAPKSLAMARTTRVALLLAPPMRAFYFATRPLVDLFNGLGNLLLKPFGIPPASELGHSPHSEGELRALLQQSSDQGLIEPEERALSEKALVFGDRRAREIMTPRPEIVYVTTADSLETAAERAADGHSRLPLCDADGGLDAPLGMIHARDLLRVFALGRGGDRDGQAATARRPSLLELARPITRVSESTRIDELLRVLRRDRRHLALVDDEHGTIVGLVTIEDILEELVGEIEDEFDGQGEGAQLAVQRDPDGVVHVDGGASIRLVAEQLGLPLEEDLHEATIGGYVLEQLGRLPEVGEQVRLDGLTLAVEAVRGTRITRLRVIDAGMPTP